MTMYCPTRKTLVSSLLAAALAWAGCSRRPETPETRGQPEGPAHGAAPAAAAAARCARHQAPQELCFLCDPARRDPGRLWCREHHRYEDRCWLCHPELQDPARPFCAAHGLYEDECFLCRPELKPPPPAAAPDKAALLMCREHGVPEAQCGICRPELVGRLQPGQSVQVRLPSVDAAALAGVRVGTPSVGELTEGVECLAELAFDQNRLAQIVAPVDGILQAVEADLGDHIKEGQVVAQLWSAAIAEAVARAVLTHQTLARERKLRAERVTSERDLQQAEAEHRAACQLARTLGFSEAQIDTFGARPDAPVYLEVRAPFAGEILERTAVRGARVEAGQPLFTLADRTVMWAMLYLPEAALGRVQVGQPVELELEALPGRTFPGRVTWVAAEVDARSRLVRARAEVPNAEGVLRARMFGRARILTRMASGALLLPAAAVQSVEGRPVVFVVREADRFEARVVRLGARFRGQWEVVEGLQPHEPVALAGSFPLKSHLLISRLGAGCAEE